MAITKVCKKCGKELSLDLFHKAKTKDGREGVCKECRKNQRPKHTKTCRECSKPFESNGKDASFCSIKCMGQFRLHDYNYVFKYFQDNGCLLLEQDYTGAHVKMKYKCECGTVANISYTDFQKGHRCSNCRNRKIAEKIRKYTIEDIEAEFKDAGLILLEDTYINNLKPMNYICECGRKSKIRYAHFLAGQRCRKCGFEKAGDKQRYDFDYVLSMCMEKGFRLLDHDYRIANQPMNVECLKCRKVSAKTFDWIKRGSKCVYCHLLENRGENHPSWNHDLTLEERQTKRIFPEYQEWRSGVFKRDDFTCRACGVKGGRLVSHHLDGYHWCKERRTDITNGVTLCTICHDAKYPGSFHSIYGNRHNTEQQFDEWIRNKRNQDAI